MGQAVFDQEFLRKLEHLALTAKMQIKDGTGGNRKSRHKGSSIEFSDFREYVYGDDFRHIDWNAYGRFEKLFIKLFMEERETVVTVFIDCSKSMDWGNPNKGVLAKRLAAVFSYLALSNFDRIALCAVNSKIQNSLTPFSGKQGFFKALKFLEDIEFEGKTTLTSALTHYSSVSSRGGISIIISDLFSDDGYKEALKFLQYKNQEITLINVLAPEEINPPWSGSVRLIDSESGEPKDLTLTPSVTKAYKKVLDGFINDSRQFCHSRGINHVMVQSDMSIDKIVFDNLVKIGVVK